MASSSGVLIGILVGVYFGVNMLQVPNPLRVASLCTEYNIRKIRLSEPNTTIIDAFVHMDIGFTFGIPNSLLKKMTDNSSVKNWFNMFVKPYISLIELEYIVVGEERHNNILPTMRVLQSLLNENSLSGVKLTTIISYTSLIIKDPPSSGAFHPNIKDNLRAIVNFLAQQDSPHLMVNLYPFKKYAYDNTGDISIDYATFGVAKPVRDGRFLYLNLFDAMLDTIYAAIDKLEVARFDNIKVVIGETGWPTHGQRPDANITVASKYNHKFIEHISSRKGTPRKPGVLIEGFIRSLFNEDATSGEESKYYGLFKNDLTPVYSLFRRH